MKNNKLSNLIDVFLDNNVNDFELDNNDIEIIIKKRISIKSKLFKDLLNFDEFFDFSIKSISFYYPHNDINKILFEFNSFLYNNGYYNWKLKKKKVDYKYIFDIMYIYIDSEEFKKLKNILNFMFYLELRITNKVY